MSKLNAKQRKAMPSSEFAGPGKSFPMNDVTHFGNDILYPVLVGARLGMHSLVLFVAFVGGLIAFGPAGLILGPCIVAAAGALAEVWEARQCRQSV